MGFGDDRVRSYCQSCQKICARTLEARLTSNIYLYQRCVETNGSLSLELENAICKGLWLVKLKSLSWTVVTEDLEVDSEEWAKRAGELQRAWD